MNLDQQVYWLVWSYSFLYHFFLFSSMVVFSKGLSESIIVSISVLPLTGIEICAIVDTLSVVFLIMVSFVSMLVMVYSIYYMKGSQFKEGFMVVLLLFSLSMVLLSISGNLVTMMIGWDGLGLTSFLLIIYFQNWKSFTNGFVTFVTNRIGDSTVIISMVLMLVMVDELSYEFKSMFSIFLLLSCMTKSAQFPFSSWLPLAMAAPTPVSSLVHSSTLVTAGLFLFLRFKFMANEWVDSAGFWVSSITILLAGSSALKETDLKKIIAQSTLSHIGLMFLLCFSGFYEVCLAHMLVHSLFKSSLFMISGLVIHRSGGTQDVRKLSLSKEPVLQSGILLCVFSMVGFPYLSGFYSKEMMLSSSSLSFSFYVMFFTSISLTCSYSFRLLVLLFSTHFPKPCSYKSSDKGMDTFVLCLMVLSSIIGGILIDLVFDQSLSFVPSFSGSWSSVMLWVSMGVGLLVGWASVKWDNKFSPLLQSFLSSFWMINCLNECFSKTTMKFSWWVMFKCDSKGLIEWMIMKSCKMTCLVRESFVVFVLSPMGLMKILSVFLLVSVVCI